MRFAVASVLLAAVACAPLTSVPTREPRLSYPPSACVLRMGASRPDRGYSIALKGLDYWRLLFPGLRQADALTFDAWDCTGKFPFHRADVAEARPLHPRGASFTPGEDDLMVGASLHQLKPVWLRSHRLGELDVGLLALLRVRGSTVEVQGTTLISADRTRTSLSVRRAGNDYFVEALEDGCMSVPTDSPCRSRQIVFRPWHGALTPVVEVDVKRRALGVAPSLGIAGPALFELESEVKLEPNGIVVLELVEVKDRGGRARRRIEHRWTMSRVGDNYSPGEGRSLWSEVTEQDGRSWAVIPKD